MGASERPDCFLAYDIRGRYPEQISPALAETTGAVIADFLKARTVVVGHDLRDSSPVLARALMAGLTRAGADVIFIGRSGTEEVYFTVFDHGTDGGIMITASHNPVEYNGMKIVGPQARPISADTGLWEIGRRVQQAELPEDKPVAGEIQQLDNRFTYMLHLLSHIDPEQLKPLKIVANAGNSGAGEIVDRMEDLLPFEFIRLNWEADGKFPKGVPNPMLEEYRRETSSAVTKCKADLGLAWDGDFDRCFFFDERGNFVEGYYLVGLLAAYLLQREAGGKIVCDTRVVWNTEELVAEAGGECVRSKAGHSFIKQTMREVGAVYGGEMSAHHYFQKFSYCDSGMIPWLIVAEMLSRTDSSLSALVAQRQSLYPVSGEINRKVEDVDAVVSAVEEHYGEQAVSTERLDGLSMEFENWRFNLRRSNTEPLLRLNVEARKDSALLGEKTTELLELIGGSPT